MALRSTPTLVSGLYATFSISDDGNLYNMGYRFIQDHKEIVVCPPKVIPSLKNIISVATGESHVACVDIEGNVYTLGSNLWGQLGVERNYRVYGNILLPQRVALPPCKQVSCGHLFTICLTKDGLVYSFGYNVSGALGTGITETFCNTPQKLNPLKDVDFIECGAEYTFCMTTNNEIYSWGRNDDGQLGLSHREYADTPNICLDLTNKSIVDIKCGHNHTLVLDSNQLVFSCGYKYYDADADYSPVFQQIEGLSDIIRIETGSSHFMCVDKNNDLYIFGNNEHGQLGLGDTKDRGIPVKHPSLSNIIDISRGVHLTFVKTSNNEIYGFGDNSNSQLGIETKDEKQITPLRVFEDNEDIWCSNIKKPKAKSARSVLPRPSNEEDNSQPKKKQKHE